MTVITEEVDKRLEALFGEEDGTVKPADGGEDFPLDGLKAKELKGLIAQRKGGEGKEKGVVGSVGMKGMSPHEAFGYALEEIKQVIRSEFQALRAELKLWREGG